MKKDINLLPCGLGHPKYTQLIIIYITLALGMVMAILPAFVRKNLLNEMRSLDKDLVGKIMTEDAYWDLNSYYDDLIMRKQLMEWTDSRLGYSDNLCDIMEGAKSHNIEVLEISLENGTITVHGVADIGSSIPDFLSYLRTIDDITEVKVKEIALDRKDMKTSVLLECNMVTKGIDLDSLFNKGEDGDIDIENLDLEETEP